ncbi:Aste57867_19789 [Aphanomyces stellatus]|uniref:Aste57867_19789 protein n=1 Tax=Aphanomyces stellatus TaxID=120398 RepID=A0A485LE29_9STRA|nr:hypothetical protein As57867_019724 [Aphanomyces stellatus]VFT96487.1 Aste57867_19789 [Aphanomyces stellatus]
MTAAASIVLRSPDLFSQLADFQDGWYEDIAPLSYFFPSTVASSSPAQLWVEKTHDGERLLCTSEQALGRFHAVFSRWMDARGSCFVGRLLTCSPSCVHVLYVYACVYGYLDIFVELERRGLLISRPPRLLDLSAWNGQLHVVEFLHEDQFEGCTTMALDWAARHGHVAIVHLLHSHPHASECTTFAMDWAALGGHLEIVHFLHVHRQEGCTTRALDGAAQHGHLSVVQYLTDMRREGCTTLAMGLAARNGHLEVVQLLHVHRNEGCTTDAMDLAAMHGHFEVVQFLHVHRSEGCTADAMKWAAENGHLSVVQFLHAHRTEGNVTDAMDGAIQCGHLPVVQYLFYYRVDPINMWALATARDNGHAHVLDWLQHAYRRDAPRHVLQHQLRQKHESIKETDAEDATRVLADQPSTVNPSEMQHPHQPTPQYDVGCMGPDAAHATYGYIHF